MGTLSRRTFPHSITNSHPHIPPLPQQGPASPIHHVSFQALTYAATWYYFRPFNCTSQFCSWLVVMFLGFCGGCHEPLGGAGLLPCLAPGTVRIKRVVMHRLYPLFSDWLTILHIYYLIFYYHIIFISAAIGAWKWTSRPLRKFCQTDRQADQPSNRQTDRPGHRKGSLPKVICFN